MVTNSIFPLSPRDKQELSDFVGVPLSMFDSALKWHVATSSMVNLDRDWDLVRTSTERSNQERIFSAAGTGILLSVVNTVLLEGTDCPGALPFAILAYSNMANMGYELFREKFNRFYVDKLSP